MRKKAEKIKEEKEPAEKLDGAMVTAKLSKELTAVMEAYCVREDRYPAWVARKAIEAFLRSYQVSTAM